MKIFSINNLNILKYPILLTVTGLFLLQVPCFLMAQETGFMGINIGMSREEVLRYAEEHTEFKVPKNRDVEFFPVEERKILTLSMEPEVPHVYLQFYNDKLYAITVIFDDKYVDYYTICNKMQEKYGKYSYLDPDVRKWEVNGVEIRVEKPAVVKYIALEEFLKVTGFVPPRYGVPGERIKKLLEGL